MADVTKSLEVIATVDDLICRVIKDVKNKSVFSFLSDAPSEFADIQMLVDDQAAVLPELKDLDDHAVAQLTAATYHLVKDILTAARG